MNTDFEWKWPHLILLLVLVYSPYYYWSNREEKQPHGILVTEEPLQSNFTSDNLPRAWKYEKSTIQPLAKYKIRARLLSKRRYYLDDVVNYAPYDLAVGWKTMSDTTVIEQLNISQADRYYFYRFAKGSFNEKDLQTQSANMHIIPAHPEVRKSIDQLRVGQIINLEGFLVRVDFLKGGEWKSSLTREDTGNGACEIMWVEQIRVE